MKCYYPKFEMIDYTSFRAGSVNELGNKIEKCPHCGMKGERIEGRHEQYSHWVEVVNTGIFKQPRAVLYCRHNRTIDEHLKGVIEDSWHRYKAEEINASLYDAITTIQRMYDRF